MTSLRVPEWGKGHEYSMSSWNVQPEEVRNGSFFFKIQGKGPKFLSVWIFEATELRLFKPLSTSYLLFIPLLYKELFHYFIRESEMD